MRLLEQMRFMAKRMARAKRIREYLGANEIRKLQLGAGPTSLPGWLCTDFAPSSSEVVYLDVTEPFPFDNGLFDYIFGEHLIEHVSWSDGGRMLKECYRVLKPGGRIRIATPDLAVLLRLYDSNGTHGREQYIKWITDKFLPGVDVYKPQFAINNAFRNWGHQFLYDGEILELALRRAGFEDITRCQYGESLHEHLRDIESHGTNAGSAEMAIYETMVYEAKRPG
jgi:predicted SAM-dependent methyltransferase